MDSWIAITGHGAQPFERKALPTGGSKSEAIAMSVPQRSRRKSIDQEAPKAQMFETKARELAPESPTGYDSKANLDVFERVAGPLRLARRTECEAAQEAFEAGEQGAEERVRKALEAENALLLLRDQVRRGKFRVPGDEEETDIGRVDVVDDCLMFKLKWKSSDELFDFPTDLKAPRFGAGRLLFLGLSTAACKAYEDQGCSQRLAAFDVVQQAHRTWLEARLALRRQQQGEDREDRLAEAQAQLDALHRERDLFGSGQGWFHGRRGWAEAQVCGIERRTRNGVEVVEWILQPVPRGAPYRWDSGGRCQAEAPADGSDCCVIL